MGRRRRGGCWFCIFFLLFPVTLIKRVSAQNIYARRAARILCSIPRPRRKQKTGLSRPAPQKCLSFIIPIPLPDVYGSGVFFTLSALFFQFRNASWMAFTARSASALSMMTLILISLVEIM